MRSVFAAAVLRRSRARTSRRIGLPKKPNDSRSWFTRNRSYEKWNVVATLVKNTNEGGATPTCTAYRMRTSLLPGLAGGCTAVIASMNLFSSPVGTRFLRASATRSIVSSSFGVRSPVAAEMCSTGAYSRNFMRRRTSSSNCLTKSGPRPLTRSHLLAAMMMPRPTRSASPAIAAS